MEMLKNWLVKLIGKRLDADLTKWGISKTKVIAWVSILVLEAPKIGALLGHPFSIPPDVMGVLAGLGLLALRDGMDNLTATIN